MTSRAMAARVGGVRGASRLPRAAARGRTIFQNRENVIGQVRWLTYTPLRMHTLPASTHARGAIASLLTYFARSRWLNLTRWLNSTPCILHCIVPSVF